MTSFAGEGLFRHRRETGGVLLREYQLLEMKEAEGHKYKLRTFFICCCFTRAAFLGLMTREPVCLRWVL